MPPVGDQLAIEGSFTTDFFASRLDHLDAVSGLHGEMEVAGTGFAISQT